MRRIIPLICLFVCGTACGQSPAPAPNASIGVRAGAYVVTLPADGAIYVGDGWIQFLWKNIPPGPIPGPIPPSPTPVPVPPPVPPSPPFIPPGPKPPPPSPTPIGAALGPWEWRELTDPGQKGWRGYGRDVDGAFLIKTWEKINAP